MSDEARARAIAREGKFWKPFAYSFAFNSEQTAERVIIFGLYSGSYKNHHAYLVEIEAEDLLNLLNDYNTKISELSAQQQVILDNIILKRYLAGVEKLIHDEKMVTKSAEVSAEAAEMDAKIAALTADQAILATLQAKVTAETTKTTARIAELQALIQMEEIRSNEVDIEIAEKEIQEAKLDLEILNAANAVLKIQLETVEAGLKLIDVDVSIARTNIDIESTRRNIARTELLEGDLEVEQARTAAAEAEKAIIESRKTLAEKKLEVAGSETELYKKMVAHEKEMKTIKVDTLEADQDRRIAAIEDRKTEAEFRNDVKEDAVDFDLETVRDAKDTQKDLDDDRVSVMERQVQNTGLVNAGEIEAARILAESVVTTSLAHFIKKYTS